MTTQEIKTAVDAGLKVYWSNKAYEVQKDKHGQYLIVCNLNSHAIGLTWADGETLNGNPNDFFTENQPV